MRILPTLCIVATAIASLGCPVTSDPIDATDIVLPATESLDELVTRTLTEYLQHRQLSTETHGAWQILHGVLAYGDQFPVLTPDGPRPTIQYLLSGGSIQGFDPLPGDMLGDPPRPGLRMAMEPTTKVGQGHRDQWLAILSQSKLSLDTEIHSGQTTFTIADWMRQIEYDVPLNLELEFSWTLIPLTVYRDTTHRWIGRDGVEYTTEQLLESELNQGLSAGACGGTHRLIGIAMALNRRRAETAPITGVWAKAQLHLDDAVRLAQQNQNPDGSFSVAYLHRPGWTRDLGERLGTTGHVLEFLAFAGSDETLAQPWVERSVRRLCETLNECRDVDLECGALYHALHGLVEYQRRRSAPR